ncbi:MAG: PAS domain S-box protein [Rubrivivax sp.]
MPLAAGRRPFFEADARGLVSRAMALRFLWTGVVVCLCGAAVSVFENFPLGPLARLFEVGSQVLLGLLCLGATRLVDRLAPRTLVLAGTWACALVATVVALALGHGAHSLDLAFYPLLVCVAAVLVGTGAAMVLALACGTVVVLLAVAELLGWVPGAAALGASPLSHPLSTHALLLGAGFMVGAILLRVSNASYREAAERESRFRGLLAIAAEHYWETDERLRLVRCDDSRSMAPSPLLAPQLQRPLEETLAALAADPAAAAEALQALRERRPFTQLRLRLTPGAATEVVELSGQPRHDAQGRFAGYWGVADDVTAQVRREAESRDALATLQTTFAASPDVLALTDADSGRFLMVNQAFQDLFGYTRAEAVGRTSVDLGTWDSADDRLQLLAAVQREGRVSGWRAFFRTRDGRRLTMQVSARLVTLGAANALLIAARDVTEAERTRAEYAALLQQAPVGIAFTRRRKVVSANPAFEDMFGWPRGAMAGQGAEAVGANDEQCAALERLFAERAARGQPQVLEARVARRDGSRFWCRLQAGPLDADAGFDGGTIWIAEDVTERRRAERELAQARDAAEAASRAKSQFLANTSHEIRTPLNGLLGLARLALREGTTEAQRRDYLQSIADSAQGLAAIMSDILDLSKIEAGRLEIEQAAFDLRALLQDLQQAHAPLARAKGLALELQADAALPAWVRGDALRVRQVVANFLSNAVKFTERGGVRLEARPAAGDRVRITVHDSGIGIAPAAQERLFQPFTQVDASTTRRHGGTGLGLSICRELARLMGGTVGVDSRPGEGSRFWAELPLPAAGPLRRRHRRRQKAARSPASACSSPRTTRSTC